MKASVLYGINDLRYTDVPMPEIGHDDALVQVKASGICGSDVNRVFKTGTYHFPTIIGHEFSGKVISVSSDNKAASGLIGKRVGVFPLKPCFTCSSCKVGKYEMCENYDYLGSRCNGGFAQYVKVPIWNLIELPDNVNFEEAAMLEPTAVAIHALRMAGDVRSKNLAIIGPGTIGNILIQVAKALGVKTVTIIGRTKEKLDFAVENGADRSINSISEDLNKILPFDIVIEGTGASESFSNAIKICRRGGKIVAMGNPSGDVVIEKNMYWQILRKQLTIKGTWNSSFGFEKDDWHMALSLLNDEKLHLSKIITHQLPFNSLLKGLEIMRDHSVYSNKIMLINNE